MLGFPPKRQREDDILLEDNVIRENKKRRPLPLYTSSDTQKPLSSESNQFVQLRPPALTPAESSDDDDDGDHNHLCHPLDQHGLLHPLFTSGSTMDLDSARRTSYLPNGDNLSPWPLSARSNGSVQLSPIPRNLVNQSLNITTPTGGNFPLSAQSMSDSAFVQHMGAATASPDAERSHGVWWDRGRLPSPISEDDDSLGKSNKTSFSDGEMAYSMSQPMSPPSCDSHDAIDPVRQSLPDRAEEPPHLAAPSAKKKVSFAMGYRADCDKCRQKVPGHYSHINWT